MNNPQLYIGLLSGTSIDGVDCGLADFSGTAPTLLHSHSQPIPDALRARILTLCENRNVSLQLLGEVDVELGRVFAEGANTLLERSGVSAARITAIGSHGQTIYHQPQGHSPFTLQLGDPNVIANNTGIATVADFRRMDMAAGGQGAPLAPLFHRAFFHSDTANRGVLNIGGIANLSLLPADTGGQFSGFDTGPGNVLMDSWIQLKRNKNFDEGGDWAAGGTVHQGLLNALLAEPYFAMDAPKSTGRELFNLDWLQSRLAAANTDIADNIAENDVQTTLLELTAVSISDSIRASSPSISELYVCGGGVHNEALMERLQLLNKDCAVRTSEEAGVPPDWVEAMTFAWLASQRWEGKPVHCGPITGARHACLLGGIYGPNP